MSAGELLDVIVGLFFCLGLWCAWLLGNANTTAVRMRLEEARLEVEDDVAHLRAVNQVLARRADDLQRILDMQRHPASRPVAKVEDLAPGVTVMRSTRSLHVVRQYR